MTIGSLLNQIFRPQAYTEQQVAADPQAVIRAGQRLVGLISLHNGSAFQIGFNRVVARQAVRAINATPSDSNNIGDALQVLQLVRIIKQDLARQVHEARKDATGQPSWYADRLKALRGLHQHARDVQHLRLGKANDRNMKA